MWNYKRGAVENSFILMFDFVKKNKKPKRYFVLVISDTDTKNMKFTSDTDCKFFAVTGEVDSRYVIPKMILKTALEKTYEPV